MSARCSTKCQHHDGKFRLACLGCHASEGDGREVQRREGSIVPRRSRANGLGSFAMMAMAMVAKEKEKREGES